METKVARFPIGTTYKTRGKHPRICTVIDIHRTFNSNGECVRLNYVSVHDFMGQPVADYQVPEAAVAMGLISTNE